MTGGGCNGRFGTANGYCTVMPAMPGCADAVPNMPFLLRGTEGDDIANNLVAWDAGA